jgi:hypothetical protein
MWVRNQLYYGSPIYPALAHNLHPLLYRLNQTAFTQPPGVYYWQMGHTIGAVAGAFVLVAATSVVARRSWGVEAGLLALCIALAAAAPLGPMLEPRHLLPATAAITVLSAILVARATLGRRWLTRTIDVLAIALAIRAVAKTGNYRLNLDEPHELDAAFQAVRDHVPGDATVLTRYTYDVFYYTRRPSTWPIPYGQKDPPIEMFLTADCDSVAGGLRRHGLRYVLAPTRPEGDGFKGTNFPRPFIRCMADLVEQGRLDTLWTSRSNVLLRLRD